MEKPHLIKQITLIFIIGIVLGPAIIGPIFNLGQFAGGTDEVSTILLSAIVPVIVASFLGSRFFNFLFTKLKYYNAKSKIQLIIELSLYAFCTFLLSWTICEVVDSLIDITFFNKLYHVWSDVFLGLPTLVWYALFPCVVTTLLYGVVLSFVIKKN